jgi:hypothetical protein
LAGPTSPYESIFAYSAFHPSDQFESCAEADSPHPLPKFSFVFSLRLESPMMRRFPLLEREGGQNIYKSSVVL